MFDDYDFDFSDILDLLPGDTDQTGTPVDIGGGGSSGSFDLNNILKGINTLFSGKSALGPAGAFLAAGGIGKLLEKFMGSGQTGGGPAGYRGGIPQYTATRTQTPIAQQRPTTTGPGGKVIPYRPGQGGITYFEPIQYTYQGKDLAAPTAPASGGASGGSGSGVTPLPGSDMIRDGYTTVITNAAGGYMPGGGIAMLARGGSGSRYLRGPGDGVSDSIPARFEKSGQPARLADGEFVIDARTVSELGNGSSEAGARKLYAMMDRVHKARKTAKRGKPSGADKFLPK
jgi:hypothetical protein